jgi:hypothetical protein
MSEPVDLAYLVFHWSGPDGAYIINMRHRRYEAIRRDDRAVLAADSPEELLDLIREDYRAHPVSRRTAGADRPQTPSCRFRPEG